MAIIKTVLPENATGEVAEMLRLCNAAGQTVVPQGGLSNLVSNTHTTSEEIALSLERMHRA